MSNARRQTRYIVVHCSATPPNSDIGADEIREWHTRKPKPGWRDIGYHAVIRRNGLIEFGRHFDKPGAHVQGMNYQSAGICMMGGIDIDGNAENNFTPFQFHSLRLLIAVLAMAYPGAEVLGHRDLYPDFNGDGVIDEHDWLKECPCFDVREWMATDE